MYSDQRLAGSSLLRGFLRRARPDPRFPVVDRRGAREAPVVWRPFHLDDGIGDRLAAPSKLLLQLRLVVDMPFNGVVDAVGERTHDRLANPLEAMLEVERPETPLDQRREHVAVRRQPSDLRALALRGVFGELLAELQPPRDDRAALTRDDVGPDLGQTAFLVVREAFVELPRDRQPEDAVPEEFEPFVGLRAVFGPRSMRKRMAQALLG
jgi:hypothetical protein